MGIKITDLTALATAPNTADVIAIVDVSDTTQALSGTTKKITIADLGFLSSGDNITELTNNAGYITSSDFSNGGELAFADRDLGNTDAFALSFITDGVGRINIEAGGNVGIGTTTPTTKLEVAGGRGLFRDSCDVIGDGGIIMRVITSGFSDAWNFDNNRGLKGLNGSFMSINNNTTNSNTQLFIKGSAGGNPLFVTDSGSTASGILSVNNDNLNVGMGIKDPVASARLQVVGNTYISGNVGIGTTTPTAKLQVAGGDFLVNSASTTEFFLIDYSADRIGINNDISNPKATVDIKGSDSLATSYSLYVQNSGNLPVMKANNSYSVAIGNHTSAGTIDARLHVKANNGGSIILAESYTANIDSDIKSLMSGSNTKLASLTAENSTGSTAKLVSYGAGYTPVPAFQDHQAIVYTNDLLFNVGNVNKATLTNAGNLGIGTTTPTNKLEVVGNTDSTTYSVNGTAGANFSGAVTNITVVDGIVTAVS